MANEHVCAILDCRALGKLDPFLPVLFDRRIEKIFHAGQQDLDLFFTLTQQVPAPLFDTQVAAAMVGYGAQPGYAPLVERVLGVTVEKTETLTDWTRRPLTAAQLAYAADDVRYLLPLHEHLVRRLEELDRGAWVQEEFRRLEQNAGARASGPGRGVHAGSRSRRPARQGAGDPARAGRLARRRGAAARQAARQHSARRDPGGAGTAGSDHGDDAARPARVSLARDGAQRGSDSGRRRAGAGLAEGGVAGAGAIDDGVRAPPGWWRCCRRCCACAPSRRTWPPTAGDDADLEALVLRHGAAAQRAADPPGLAPQDRWRASARLLEGRASVALDPTGGRVRVRIQPRG